MRLFINGQEYSTLKENLTVLELLEELSKKWDIDLMGAVVLVNDEIVKKSEWKNKKLARDYHLEVLSFVSGG